MIDCRTKFGQWRIASLDIQIVGIEKHNNLPKTASIIYTSEGERTYFYNWHLSFYDLNGNYTGFRLKQLK